MNEIVLTSQQQQAVDLIKDWYRNPSKSDTVFTLAGFAGTGKSSIIPAIIDELGLSEDQVAICSFTGKASTVLQSKGLSKARTIHSTIYQYDPVYRRFNLVEIFPYSLIIVDEASMVPKDLFYDMQTLCNKIILIGDPGQLPPVSDKAYHEHDMGRVYETRDTYELLQSPNYHLREIHRQAFESPIIRLSVFVRNHGLLSKVELPGGVRVVEEKDFDRRELLKADQVICPTNKKRISLNREIRRMLKLPSNEVVDQDKLICLTNSYEAGTFLSNGTTGTAILGDDSDVDRLLDSLVNDGNCSYERFFSTLDLGSLDSFGVLSRFISDTTTYKDLLFYKPQLISGLPMNEFFDTYNEVKYSSSNIRIPKLNKFDFGYCITVHKSQGSQYNKLIIFADGAQYFDYAQLMYTAITRAVEELTIVI